MSRSIVPTAQWQDIDATVGAPSAGRLYPIEVGGVWGFTTVRPGTGSLVLDDGVVGIDEEVYPSMLLAGVGGWTAMIRIPAYTP